MEVLGGHDVILSKLCAATKKWGMYISCAEFLGYEHLVAPYLDPEDEAHYQIIDDGAGFILFNTKEEMEDAYNRTVGDDGPTELNPYDGPIRVYALTCGPDGELLTENT